MAILEPEYQYSQSPNLSVGGSSQPNPNLIDSLANNGYYMPGGNPNAPYNGYLPPSAYYQPGGAPYQNPGRVLGDSTNIPSGGNSGGGGGGGGGGGSNPGFDLKNPNANPGPDWFWDAADGWKKKGGGGLDVPAGPSDQELDSIYNPIMDHLNQAESTLRGDFPRIGQEIDANYGTSKQTLDNSLASGQNTINTQLTTGSKQRYDVIADARRLFSELMMANQQRFGGASSAGMAASELQGREFQRNTAKANEQYTNLSQELGVKKLEMEQNYQVAAQKLLDKKQADHNEALRQFQEKLLQINQLRANTQAERASRRLQALQDYKNQVFQINLQNYQLEQQLEAAKAQSAIELDNYAKQLQLSQSGAGQAYNSFQSSMSQPMQMSKVGGGTQRTQTQLPTGYKTDDELMTGYAPGLYDRTSGQQVGSSLFPQLVN